QTSTTTHTLSLNAIRSLLPSQPTNQPQKCSSRPSSLLWRPRASLPPSPSTTASCAATAPSAPPSPSPPWRSSRTATSTARTPPKPPSPRRAPNVVVVVDPPPDTFVARPLSLLLSRASIPVPSLKIK
ncbi:uncharacterized protein K452DRAFT_317512, partial [Aplosporella prunicola CBS 121167]